MKFLVSVFLVILLSQPFHLNNIRQFDLHTSLFLKYLSKLLDVISFVFVLWKSNNLHTMFMFVLLYLVSTLMLQLADGNDPLPLAWALLCVGGGYI